MEEMEETVVQKETLISELSSEIDHQCLQLRRLTQVQSELSSAKEMSEVCKHTHRHTLVFSVVMPSWRNQFGIQQYYLACVCVCV